MLRTSAGCAAEFGRATGVDGLKFANDFLGEVGSGEVCGIVVDRESVENEVVIQVALSGEGDSGAGHGERHP